MNEKITNTSLKHSQLMEMIYLELRQYADHLINQEFNGVTFQATELANESYLKLIDSDNIDWGNPKQFMSAAVVVMRRYLVDHARKKLAHKRIPDHMKVSLDDLVLSDEPINQQIVLLDDVLTQLEKLDVHQAKVVELRFFAGLSETEIAQLFKVSRRTISREWKMAKMWLKLQMQS